MKTDFSFKFKVWLVLTIGVICFLGLSPLESWADNQKIGKIVYSTKGTGGKIFVMNEDGTEPVQLTFGPGRDAGPLWSPCGTKIYFHSNRETGGNPGDYYEIFVMNNDGSNLRKIASIPGANCAGGDWYYDGSKIGFSVNFGSNDNSIYWVSVDEPGSEPEPLYDVHTKIDFCSFSPDGTKMLFIQWGNLYIMNIDGTGTTLVGNAQRADWLPNTDSIVYVALSSYRDIWTFNTTTLEKKQLTFEYPTQEFFLTPNWSWPDAQKIVYNRAGDLWIMNSDGSNKIQLTFDGLPGEGSGDLYYFEKKNSPPEVSPSGGGVYEINTEVILGGYVSDYDGDLLDYQWMEGTNVLFSGAIQTIDGGTLVELPNHSISTLSPGVHTITIQVDDGVNEPVSGEITVEIVDATSPSLDPAANMAVLWPANHKMVDIVIEANASDNSGLPITLSASISSNEPINGTGDGDHAPDWTEPVIDQENGIITFQLRAERSGKGSGRVYTITVTATDNSNNSTTAYIVIAVPHDKKKK